MKRFNRWTTPVFLCIFFFSTVAGCGKKGLPVPPPEEIPPAVTDLAAVIDGPELTLTWTVPQGDNADDLVGFKVYRSTTPRSADDCRDCPVRFRLFADIMIGDSGAIVSENGKMTYRSVLTEEDAASASKKPSGSPDEPPPVPENRKTGYGYQYKLIGYTEYNVRSPDSNVAAAIPLVQTETGQGGDDGQE